MLHIWFIASLFILSLCLLFAVDAILAQQQLSRVV